MENDQIQRERVLEKLGKIKALAEKGIGGEKETAMRMYAELCRKYDISDDEAQIEKVEERWFSYRTDTEERLLRQVFYKVTGSTDCYVYVGPYKRRKKRGVMCTRLEALEIELLFNFYREQLKAELEVFMGAFMSANSIYPDESARCYKEREESELTDKEKEKMFRMALMAGQINASQPPRAAIEEKDGEKE